MIITAIPHEVVEDFWPIAEQWMDRATRVTKGLFSAQDVLDSITKNDMALWGVFEDDDLVPVAAFTTRLVVYPNGKGLVIDWIGGRKMPQWIRQMSELMDRYAADNDCTHIEGMGRKGWARVLGDLGYKQVPAFKKTLIMETAS